MAVAHRGRALTASAISSARDVVGAEGAQADGRHQGAGVKSSLGDQSGVDCWLAGNGVHVAETKFHGTRKSEKYQALSLT